MKYQTHKLKVVCTLQDGNKITTEEHDDVISWRTLDWEADTDHDVFTIEKTFLQKNKQPGTDTFELFIANGDTIDLEMVPN